MVFRVSRSSEICQSISVSSISVDPNIIDIFRFPFWTADEGIDYLSGIFDEYVDEDDHCHIQTLDGTMYSEPADQGIVEVLLQRRARLMRIFVHGNKIEKWSRIGFIRWGLKHRDISDLSWLADAQAKGLVPKDISNKRSKLSDANDKKLTNGEKTALLKIIAGLFYENYRRLPSRGDKTEVMQAIEKVGLKISENTLNGHLDEAWDILRDAIGAFSKPQ